MYGNLHPDKARLLSVEFLNKASVTFFNFLLDGHPELCATHACTYPCGNKYSERLARECYKSITGSFLLSLQDDRLPVTYPAFKRDFKQYLSEFGVTRKTIFLAMNYAVAKGTGKRLEKVKYVVLHTHGDFRQLMPALHDFPHKMIVLVRDPRAAHLSYQRDWLFPLYMHTLWDVPYLSHVYDRIADDLLYIRHEDLHREYARTRKRACAFLGIADDKSLDHSTVFGNIWTGKKGDKTLSSANLALSTPSPRYAKDSWKEKLSASEISLIQRWMRPQMRRFKYPIFRKQGPTLPRQMPPYEDLIDHTFFFLKKSKLTKGIPVFLHDTYVKKKDVAVIGSLYRATVHLFSIMLVAYQLAQMQAIYLKYVTSRRRSRARCSLST